MNKIRRSAAILLLLSALPAIQPAEAASSSYNLARIKLPSSATGEETVSTADTQKAQAELADSLLSTIEIDPATLAAFATFSPSYIAPNILGRLEDNQVAEMEIPLSSYSQLAGVISVGNNDADDDATAGEESITTIIYPAVLPAEVEDPIPDWFKAGLRSRQQVFDASFKMMMRNPASIEYADWNLPQPPRLPKEDFSFHGFLRRLHLPEISPEDAKIPEVEIPRKNWLHYFNVALQVSQAYLSSNWYQGGNSYVSGLFNFTWNVDLNQVYHPNLLFQSSLQYKLAVNSNPKGSLHKYNTSQDLFQYTLKTGLKAFNHWFYSLNALFNTQLFNAFPEDSKQRSSTLLSPGTFNLGLGMTYSLEKKGAKLTVSISPLAYNLKTCIAKDIDHLQFGIEPGRRTVSEIGSSAEANLTWKFTNNISWTSRMFLFTDYHYFLADWENTFNFQINKFLSTMIFLHPRFDSSSEWNSSKWHYWMFREILSFGVSYTFATPK